MFFWKEGSAGKEELQVQLHLWSMPSASGKRCGPFEFFDGWVEIRGNNPCGEDNEQCENLEPVLSGVLAKMDLVFGSCCHMIPWFLPPYSCMVKLDMLGDM
ncbi:hypothetical protein KP509_37G011300 [Ceratopteris richardii]|uniref:Uncharacterized protein n=1 Tax=Ceratopteris richardii TaxID=49495 RepID=A0A8T2Q645_CERRI|nr:hypothetical protein KP509_37G011300 [Ceratopteris richardii]